MTSFLNFIRKVYSVPVTLTDRILEMTAFAMALIFVIFTIILYIGAPEQVPIHFNLAGEPDGWSDKNAYWGVMFLILLSMALCNMAAYNHKMVNLPFRLRPECLSQQLALVGRMVRILSLLLGILGFVLLFMTSAPQLKMESSDWNPLFIVILCAITIDIIFYTIQIWRIGKRF